MALDSLYPVLVGVVDIGLAGVLLLIAPLLGVLMTGVGVLVVGVALHREFTAPQVREPSPHELSESDTVRPRR
jgi:membrane-bound metal-dependent hydrolase YbcI (DUF457 family)